MKFREQQGDTVEDEIAIGGIHFRFIDTAGIRETEDTIERIGIERSFEKIEQATLVLFLVDITKDTQSDIDALRNKYPGKNIQIVANKIDHATAVQLEDFQKEIPMLPLFLPNKPKASTISKKN